MSSPPQRRFADSTPLVLVLAEAGRIIGREAESRAFAPALQERHWLCSAGDLRAAASDPEVWHRIEAPGRLKLAIQDVLSATQGSELPVASSTAATPSLSVPAVPASPNPAAAERAADAREHQDTLEEMRSSLVAAPSVSKDAAHDFLRVKFGAKLSGAASHRDMDALQLAAEVWHDAWS